jgi:ABC-type multidrug transport system fused ATPase/permease subunit
MILVSSLDGIGLLLLIPVINYSGLVSIESGNGLITKVLGLLQPLSNTTGLLLVLVLFIVVSFIQNLFHRYITIGNTKIQHGFTRYVRIEIYRKLLHANWDFYLKRRKTDLINVITAELSRVSAGINVITLLITSIIFTLIQVSFAFLLSPTITIFVLICGGFSVFFSRGYIKRSAKLGRKTSELGKNFLAGVTDYFNGMKEIKSNTLEKPTLDWYESISDGMYKEQMEYITLKTSSQFNYKIISSLLIAIFIFLSVHLFNAQSAQLMLIIIIFARLWPRLTSIQTNLEQIASVIPSLQKVIDLEQDSEFAREVAGHHHSMNQPIVIQEGIELKNIFFQYNESENVHALNRVSATFKANAMTAIVGKSGAGKSTLIDVLMGLLVPQKGSIVVDGQIITNENFSALRQSISYVSQDPFLFNGTIRDNLLMIDPNAKDEQLWKALRFSAAEEFVRLLPNGLDTIIGDRGVRLSGGERQRLVLARAILRKPKILILDEATSALDSDNEAKIQEAIEGLKGRMTIIVIAHRLSTIRNADDVIVLDRGEIIQKGGFDQLAQKRGIFKNLLGKQLETAQLEATH